MNIKELIQNIEKYFGDYENAVIKSAVIKFINDNWDESEYPGLLNKTVKQYSTQYKTQPDVAFFNKLWESENSIQDQAEKAWNDLLEMKTARSVLIVDITAQEVIKSMGGIDDFVHYRQENNHWCRKDFIERYDRLYQSSKQKQPEILLNEIERIYPSYPQSKSNIKIIGNPTQGKLLLEKAEDTRPILKNGKEMKQIGDIIKDTTKTFSEV
jgi:hypothetical protein